MTCPNCRCPECRAAAVNAVLARYVEPRAHLVSRETISVDEENAAAIPDNREREQWRDTYGDAR